MKKLLAICSLFFLIALSSTGAVKPPGVEDNLVIKIQTNPEMMVQVIATDYSYQTIVGEFQIQLISKLEIPAERIYAKDAELNSRMEGKRICLILKKPSNEYNIYLNIEAIQPGMVNRLPNNVEKLFSQTYETINRHESQIFIEGRLKPVSGGELTA